MYTVSHLRGTAPANLVVVQGVGRALNPTPRSGKPMHTNLSAQGYDNESARHRSGAHVNNFRTEAFDTPVLVTRKGTGWMTVSGGKDSLSVTFAPDAVVVFALVEQKDKHGNVTVTEVRDMSLFDYQEAYC